MLPIIFVVLVLIVAAVVILVAVQPSDFIITRATNIAAPPSAIYPHINNLHHWEAWSPWAKIDPDMNTTYEGPDEGEGASYSWNGNNKVGEGKMTITETVPNEKVVILLEFKKPMVATNVATLSLEPAGENTSVTWTMTGNNNFMGKAFALFMNMDKMVGNDFEKGLANLDAVVTGASEG